MNIDWIINTPAGNQFLTRLLNTENTAVYDNEIICDLITYLF